jgi:hypothetical protein
MKSADATEGFLIFMVRLRDVSSTLVMRELYPTHRSGTEQMVCHPSCAKPGHAIDWVSCLLAVPAEVVMSKKRRSAFAEGGFGGSGGAGVRDGGGDAADAVDSPSGSGGSVQDSGRRD